MMTNSRPRPQSTNPLTAERLRGFFVGRVETLKPKENADEEITRAIFGALPD